MSRNVAMQFGRNGGVAVVFEHMNQLPRSALIGEGADTADQWLMYGDAFKRC